MNGRTLAIALAFVAACDESPPTVVSESEGNGVVQYAIGSDVRQMSYDEVRCEREPGDLLRVELLSNRVIPGPQGRPHRPRIVVARLDGDDVTEAHAFVPQAIHADVEYDMLHFVADPTRCELTRGEQLQLVCNETTVVPWLAAGERPRPSFKLEFVCPD